MDQPGDEMLFGVESQESCVHPSIPDNKDKQHPTGSNRAIQKRSRAAASNTHTHPIVDQHPLNPTPISELNSSNSSQPLVVELPPGKRDRYCLIKLWMDTLLFSSLLFERLLARLDTATISPLTCVDTENGSSPGLKTSLSVIWTTSLLMTPTYMSL